jgi:predicted RNA-binding protein with PIN domain
MTTNRLWLIDGHNVIFAIPSLKDLQVTGRRDEARRSLADRLQRFAHARGERVLIVFDGTDLASHPDARRESMLEITYTRPAEGGADNRIIYEAGQRAGQRRPVTVVTNDVRTIITRLPRGVDALGAEEFWLKHIDQPPAPGAKRVEGDFSDVEHELLAQAAVEDAAIAAAPRPASPARRRPTASRAAAGPEDARPPAEQARRDRLRLKRETGRLRQQRRLERQRKPGRRR